LKELGAKTLNRVYGRSSHSEKIAYILARRYAAGVLSLEGTRKYSTASGASSWTAAAHEWFFCRTH
jgi:hypothetical protein